MADNSNSSSTPPPTVHPSAVSPGTSAQTPSQRLTDAEIDERLAYVDGVNGSAGNHLADPYLRDLLRQKMAGEITGDQYRELGLEHLRKQAQQ